MLALATALRKGVLEAQRRIKDLVVICYYLSATVSVKHLYNTAVKSKEKEKLHKVK